MKYCFCSIGFLESLLILLCFLSEPINGDEPEIYLYNYFQAKRIAVECISNRDGAYEEKRLASSYLRQRGHRVHWVPTGSQHGRHNMCRVSFRLGNFIFNSNSISVFYERWNVSESFITATVDGSTGRQKIKFGLMEDGVNLFNFSSGNYVNQCGWSGKLQYEQVG